MSNWHEHLQNALSADVTPRRAEARRLADAMRRVINAVVASDAPEHLLIKAADEGKS